MRRVRAKSSQLKSFSSTRHTATECQGPIGFGCSAVARCRQKLFKVEELKESQAAACGRDALARPYLSTVTNMVNFIP